MAAEANAAKYTPLVTVSVYSILLAAFFSLSLSLFRNYCFDFFVLGYNLKYNHVCKYIFYYYLIYIFF